MGAQRARLRPLSRWQHLLLHWALFRQSRHPARGQLVSPASSLWSPVHTDPQLTTHYCQQGPTPWWAGMKESNPWGWRPLPTPTPDPLAWRCRQCGIVKVALGWGQGAQLLGPAALPAPWVNPGPIAPSMPQCSHLEWSPVAPKRGLQISGSPSPSRSL